MPEVVSWLSPTICHYLAALQRKDKLNSYNLMTPWPKWLPHSIVLPSVFLTNKARRSPSPITIDF